MRLIKIFLLIFKEMMIGYINFKRLDDMSIKPRNVVKLNIKFFIFYSPNSQKEKLISNFFFNKNNN